VANRIEVQGLGKAYNDRWLFRDLDIIIPDNSVMAVQGPNGSGKTTLLYILCGLVAASSGYINIVLEDREVTQAVATHFACRHGSGFFLSYMAEFWDNEWRVQRVGACHSFFTRGKAKERTPWPASLVRSFSRSYNPDDYTERTAICREIYGDFQGCLPRRIPTCGLPTLQLAG